MLKNDEEPLVAPSIVVPSDGRPLLSLSLASLSIEGSRSFPFSRFIPKEIFEAFFARVGRGYVGVVRPVSLLLEDGDCWWPALRGEEVSIEARSIEGR